MIQPMTDEEYHAHPALGRSGMWLLHTKTPAHYKANVGKDTSSLRLGKAAHMATLQPQMFMDAYVVNPGLNKNSNAYKAWLEDVTMQGKLAIDGKDRDTAMRISNAVHAQPVVRELLRDALFEQAAIVEIDGVEVKAKPDIWSPSSEILADLKTSRDASPRAFAKACAVYGYHLQEPVYTTVWAKAVDRRAEGFLFIVVEPEPPHLVSLYELTPQDYEEGYRIMDKALRIYRECRDKNEWPGYGTEIKQLTLPAWAFNTPVDEEAA